jgi:hypothetical protein
LIPKFAWEHAEQSCELWNRDIKLRSLIIPALCPRNRQCLSTTSARINRQASNEPMETATVQLVGDEKVDLARKDVTSGIILRKWNDDGVRSSLASRLGAAKISDSSATSWEMTTMHGRGLNE